MDELAKLATIPPWGWSESAPDQILEGLRSGDREQQHQATVLAAEPTAMNDEVARALLQLAGEADGELAAAAVSALAPALREAFDLSGDEVDERFDHRALSPAAVDEVLVRLERAVSSRQWCEGARQAALCAIAEFPRPALAPLAQWAWDQGTAAWRAAALRAAAGVPALSGLIRDALEGEDEGLWPAAVFAAATLELHSQAHRVLELGRMTENEALVLAVVEALVNLHPAGGEEWLRGLALGEGPVAQAAAETLEDRRYFSQPPAPRGG